MDLKEAVKKRAEQESKKNKSKTISLESKREKAKSDFFGMAKNPMFQMAAQSLSPKIKLLIALAVLMLLTGIGTTIYWAVILFIEFTDAGFVIIGALALFALIKSFMKKKTK